MLCGHPLCNYSQGGRPAPLFPSRTAAVQGVIAEQSILFPPAQVASSLSGDLTNLLFRGAGAGRVV